MVKIKIFICLIFISLILLISCKLSFENKIKSNSTQNRECLGSVCLKTDSMCIEFVYNPIWGSKADNEVYIPIPFSIKLPRGIKDIQSPSVRSFIFEYPHHQKIILSIDQNSKRDSLIDTLFSPNKNDIIAFDEKMKNGFDSNINLLKEFLRFNNSKHKSFIYRRCRIEILLLNIKSSNFNYFFEQIQNIRFLKWSGDWERLKNHKIMNEDYLCE